MPSHKYYFVGGNEDETGLISLLDFDSRHSTKKELDQNPYAQKMIEFKELFPRTGWCMIDWIEFYAVLAIFQPCNGDGWCI